MALQKLGRTGGQRKALLRGLVASVLIHGKIETTAGKAKAAKPLVDKMVTLGKRGDLHARRQAAAYLANPDAVRKLFEEVAPNYTDRNGGYTRLLKLPPRQGDGAPMAILELV